MLYFITFDRCPQGLEEFSHIAYLEQELKRKLKNLSCEYNTSHLPCLRDREYEKAQDSPTCAQTIVQAAFPFGSKNVSS
jgi:hypothetical protein